MIKFFGEVLVIVFCVVLVLRLGGVFGGKIFFGWLNEELGFVVFFFELVVLFFVVFVLSILVCVGFV